MSGGEEFVGFTHRMGESTLPHSVVRARLMAEDVLLLAVRDWLRNLGFASYDSVKVRPRTASGIPPDVAHLQWDLSAPSYMRPLTTRTSGGVKPGFIVADTVLVSDVSEPQARYFLNKCALAWLQRNSRPMLPFFIAERFTKDALRAGRGKGAVFCTPSDLLGEEVAQALSALVGVLANAASVASSDPGKIDRLVTTLTRIEGAANTLRGPLFEMIVGMCVREHEGTSIDMGLRVLDPDTGEGAEVDVLRVKGREEVWAYECKGRLPPSEISLGEVKDWLERQVPRINSWIRAQQRFSGCRVGFSFWTSSRLAQDARTLLESAAAATRKYQIGWKEGEDVYRYAKEARSQYATKLLDEHFRKHPLAQPVD
jgi:hypothetical protein